MKKMIMPAVVALAFTAASCDGNKEDKDTVTTDVTTTEQTTTAGGDTTGTAATTGAGTNDVSFAMTVADGGLLEVKLGQLAQKSGSSAKIKELGKMLEDDHTKANDELIVWAMKNSVTLPTTMSAEKQAKYDSLAALKGAAFDKAFAATMVANHEKNIGVFKTQADQGSNAELKAWAAGKLPVLEHHLQMAKGVK
jgi:putative membrane protein